MCGIFSLINYHNTSRFNFNKLMSSFDKGVYRGPEFSSIKSFENFYMGFHRLAINGLDNISNQPFQIDNIILICNGEIYNFRELAKYNNINLSTNSDCEIILHLYKLYGIEYTLTILDGVFSFILYDKNISKFFIARDPYGVRPLYFLQEHNLIGFASELKMLYNIPINKKNIFNFLPGYYMSIKNNEPFFYDYRKYTSFPCSNIIYEKTIFNNHQNNIYSQIYSNISSAVSKRVIGTTDRPIGCLLSGGLDSSLITALVNKFYNKETLHTFSIGLKGSEDLKNATLVANHINSIHHKIVVDEDDFFNAIPEVIKIIESYDTTTVRASVGNYLVSKYIKENTDCKVIFNGDGADELMGGYLYMKKAPSFYEFDRECKRLLQDIYMFDVLRSDKSISSNGLEPRTPFLDKSWVEFYLSIDKKLRYDTTIKHCEKYLIRKTFDVLEPDLLPKEILWRTKEAFSDGVSGLNKSWYEIIQEKLDKMFIDDINLKHELDKIIKIYDKFNLQNKPDTYEKAYYRYLYNMYYQNTDHLIGYYWMPKYVNAKDASARTLDIYKDDNKCADDNDIKNNTKINCLLI